MPTRAQLEKLLEESQIHFEVKKQVLAGGVAERSIYELVYKNHRLDVYETVSPGRSVTLRANGGADSDGR